jgi:hypothetical protein
LPITSDDSDIITIIGTELNGSRSCFEAAHGLQSRVEDVTVRLAEPIGVFTRVESPNYGPPNANADDRIFLIRQSSEYGICRCVRWSWWFPFVGGLQHGNASYSRRDIEVFIRGH